MIFEFLGRSYVNAPFVQKKYKELLDSCVQLSQLLTEIEKVNNNKEVIPFKEKMLQAHKEQLEEKRNVLNELGLDFIFDDIEGQLESIISKPLKTQIEESVKNLNAVGIDTSTMRTLVYYEDENNDVVKDNLQFLDLEEQVEVMKFTSSIADYELDFYMKSCFSKIYLVEDKHFVSEKSLNDLILEFAYSNLGKENFLDLFALNKRIHALNSKIAESRDELSEVQKKQKDLLGLDDKLESVVSRKTLVKTKEILTKIENEVESKNSKLEHEKTIRAELDKQARITMYEVTRTESLMFFRADESESVDELTLKVVKSVLMINFIEWAIEKGYIA